MSDAFLQAAAADTDGGGQGCKNGHDDVDDGFPGFFLHNSISNFSLTLREQIFHF